MSPSYKRDTVQPFESDRVWLINQPDEHFIECMGEAHVHHFLVLAMGINSKDLMLLLGHSMDISTTLDKWQEGRLRTICQRF